MKEKEEETAQKKMAPNTQNHPKIWQKIYNTDQIFKDFVRLY